MATPGPGGEPSARRQPGPWLLQATLALVWGGHWAVAKIGLEVMPPFTYGVLRLVVAAVALALLLVATGRLRLPSRHDLPIVLSVGLGQMAGQIAAMNLGLQYVAAGRSAVLLYTMPLWVAVLQAALLRRAPSARELVGLVLGLAGIVVLLDLPAVAAGSRDVVTGSAVLLAGAIVWGATIIHLRQHRWEGSTLELTLWELLVALVPLAALAALLEPGRPPAWGAQAAFAVLFSGLLASAFAFWASQAVQRALEPMVTAIGFLAVPVVGLIAGAVALGEQVSAADVAGVVVTLAGIAAISLPAPGHRTEARAQPTAEAAADTPG